MHGCQDIGPDYAITLRAWRSAWEAKKADVLALGYSERFWRKYQFYFACESAQASGCGQRPSLLPLHGF